MDGFYVVDETEQAVITQFGNPVGEAITEPGLTLKIPFIQTANYLKEISGVDGDSKSGTNKR